MKFYLQIILMTILLMLGSRAGAQADGDPFQQLLKTVEAQHPLLQAWRVRNEGEGQRQRAANRLPDPQASAFYLPFGDHQGSDYWEYQITQELSWPTVYMRRSDLNQVQGAKRQAAYQKKRRALLLKAYQFALEAVYLHQRLDFLAEQSKAEQPNRADTLGINTSARAKLQELEAELKEEALRERRREVLAQLKRMGASYRSSDPWRQYPQHAGQGAADSALLAEPPTHSGVQLILEKQRLAQASLALGRAEDWPQITFGFNYQGVANSNYSGFYGGLNIPLWGKNRSAEARQAERHYHRLQAEAAQAEWKQQYKRKLTSWRKFRQQMKRYRQLFQALPKVDELRQQLRNGTIALSTFRTHLQTRRQAQERLLEMNYKQEKKRAWLLHQEW